MNKQELDSLLGKVVKFTRPNSSEIEGKIIAVDYTRNSVDVEAIGEYWRNVPINVIKEKSK
jgi:hypothetical protein